MARHAAFFFFPSWGLELIVIMVIWCFWLSNSVFNHFLALDKVRGPAISNFLPDPWVKMILWGNFSQSSLAIFEHKYRAKTLVHTILWGSPSSLHPLGQLCGARCPGTCTSPFWCLCHWPKHVPSLWNPTLCPSLGTGDLCFSDLEWDGKKVLPLSLVPTEDHSLACFL